MKFVFIGVSLLTSMFWLAPAHAQGLNCASPSQISGPGDFAFDSTGGFTTNFGSGTPCVIAPFGLAREFYFQWTPAQSGDYRFEIPNIDGDISLSVYDGVGCQAVCLVRGARTATEVTADVFGVQAGDSFLVQIANTSGLGTSGSGAVSFLSVEHHPCDLGVTPDDAFEENDTCLTATPLVPGTYPNLWTHQSDTDFYEVTIPPLHTADINFMGVTYVTFIRELSENCSEVFPTHREWIKSNATFAPVTYILEVYPALNGVCADYDLSFGLVENACNPSTAGDDVLEENDDLANATLLAPGTYTNLVVTQADMDYYKVELPPYHSIPRNIANSSVPLTLSILGEGGDYLHSIADDVVFNSSNQVLDVYYQYQSGTNLCVDYSVTVAPVPEPCSAQNLDVLDDAVQRRSNYSRLSNGTYPNLNLWDYDRYAVCIGPFSSVTVQLNLLPGSGALEASLICIDFLEGCSETLLDQGVGQQVLLQYTNPTNSTKESLLEVHYLDQGGPANCARYDMSIAGMEACFDSDVLYTTEFCSPGAINSTGQSTQLIAFGAGQPNLLGSFQGPPGQFGFLVAAVGSNGVGTPLGNGQYCLTGQVGRYTVPGGALNSLGAFDEAGRFLQNLSASNPNNIWSYQIPTTTPWGTAIFAGDTLHFQLWHREPGGASNLSNGLSVQF